MSDDLTGWLVAAFLLLVVLALLGSWALRRDPTAAEAESNSCPACPGELRECSGCGGNWRDRRCTDCRLGRTCSRCHLSWAYYVKNERNVR